MLYIVISYPITSTYCRSMVASVVFVLISHALDQFKLICYFLIFLYFINFSIFLYFISPYSHILFLHILIYYLFLHILIFYFSIGSAEAIVKVDIQSWNYPPVVPEKTSLYVIDRKATVIDLVATDVGQGQFIEVYITALPTKGENDIIK